MLMAILVVIIGRELVFSRHLLSYSVKHSESCVAVIRRFSKQQVGQIVRPDQETMKYRYGRWPEIGGKQ